MSGDGPPRAYKRTLIDRAYSELTKYLREAYKDRRQSAPRPDDLRRGLGSKIGDGHHAACEGQRRRGDFARSLLLERTDCRAGFRLHVGSVLIVAPAIRLNETPHGCA